ncbi:MAG: M20/M25/M40 family metallo-hydrolase [Sphaerochaetaceae bacterium]
MENFKQLLKNLLIDTVEIPSVNGTEENLGQYLYQFGLNNGLGVFKQYCTDTRFNVLLTYPAVDLEETTDFALILHAHYDTVPPLDMQEPFVATVEGDYIKGRGAVDQKGGLVAALGTLMFLKENRVSLDKPICLAAVIDEESEHRGSMVLSQSKIRGDFGIVTEPSILRAVLGCKGTLPIQITVEGKTAHGCRPWLGINAVEKSLGILKRLFEYEFEKVDFGKELGVLHNSINVGLIEAGTAYNNVPDKCVISLDCRIKPDDENQQMFDTISQIIEEAKKEDPSLNATFKVAREDWDWPPIEKRGLKSAYVPLDSEIFKIAKKAHFKVNKKEIESYITDGYADLDFLINDMDIPSIIYGPGDPKLCHTAYEKISLEDVVKASLFYYEFVMMIQR